MKVNTGLPNQRCKNGMAFGLISPRMRDPITNGTLGNTYAPGTNPEEISILNAVGTSLVQLSVATNATAQSNRIMYLSPGMLTLSNGGRLTNADLRYVTPGLLQWTNAWHRIPVGLGYKDSTQLKLNLNDSNARTLGALADKISNNLPIS